MSNPPSISAVITAYNEERTLADAVHDTEAALKKYNEDYEIIVVNDASLDRTGAILEELACHNKHIVAIHNAVNKNIGYNLRVAVHQATKQYIFALIGADNYPTPEVFQRLLNAVGITDMVIGYQINYGNRTWFRRLLSHQFSNAMNWLFWQKIHYYNGPIIVATKEWQTVPMTTNGFAYMAEVVVTLLKRGLTYIEVPVSLTPERKGMNWWALRRNIGPVIKTIASLFWRLNIKKELHKKSGSKNF